HVRQLERLLDGAGAVAQGDRPHEVERARALVEAVRRAHRGARLALGPAHRVRLGREVGAHGRADGGEVVAGDRRAGRGREGDGPGRAGGGVGPGLGVGQRGEGGRAARERPRGGQDGGGQRDRVAGELDARGAGRRAGVRRGLGDGRELGDGRSGGGLGGQRSGRGRGRGGHARERDGAGGDERDGGGAAPAAWPG